MYPIVSVDFVTHMDVQKVMNQTVYLSESHSMQGAYSTMINVSAKMFTVVSSYIILNN